MNTAPNGKMPAINVLQERTKGKLLNVYKFEIKIIPENDIHIPML